MSEHSSHHAKGLVLTAIGGLTLTVDIPLIRLANGDPWSILMLRSGATVISAIVVWTAWRLWRGNAPALIPGRAGLLVASLYSLASICFLMAVFYTSTADLVFILAFNSMFAALLSWFFLGERPRPQTLAAMALVVIGVAVIVGSGIGTGNLFGNVLAVLTALLIASAITVTRATGKDMGFTALVAVSLPFVVAAFMVSRTGYQVEAPWWILLNGAIVIPIAFFLLASGPKYITGPEVAMFYLLETVLAPIWVWLIFSEAPGTASLAGGALIILTLVAHSLWQVREGRKRRATPALRHPT
ncbi:DMT family transporter [Mesorhizobium xinjiangense]|uniref:DMT family transporter n=1 Tax=Mesorhizobium xinjiangense TaxID=2678685 RepID=UPI0012ED89FA|nr:DMT family transporter [Mesorhizobium xinjiangense]